MTETVRNVNDLRGTARAASDPGCDQTRLAIMRFRQKVPSHIVPNQDQVGRASELLLFFPPSCTFPACFEPRRCALAVVPSSFPLLLHSAPLSFRLFLHRIIVSIY